MLEGLVGDLIKIFESGRLLEEAGWLPCEDPKSPRWWGGLESYDEVSITAILVQRSTWRSVERALENLRTAGLTSLERLANASCEELEEAIRPVSFRRGKARRLIGFAKKVVELGGLEGLRGAERPRDILMGIKGIGRETADSILLFALNTPTIPISRHIRLVLERVGALKRDEDYEALRMRIVEILKGRIRDLKLLYAGLTSIGKLVCKGVPKCSKCQLKGLCKWASSTTVKPYGRNPSRP